jgi:hypothetical protein
MKEMRLVDEKEEEEGSTPCCAPFTMRMGLVFF